MRKLNKVLVSMVLAMTLLVSQFTVMAAEDVSAHWAGATVEKWESLGVIGGYPDGSFKLDNSVTRAEFVKMLSMTFGYTETSAVSFTDVAATDWYYEAVVKAATVGVITGFEGKFRPNDLISREEAAVVLSRAYKMEASATTVSGYSDFAKVASWANEAVVALVEKGYMNGRTASTLVPQGNLTRAEAVTLLNNISGQVITTAGTVADATYAGNVLINAADVELSNVTIAGNLYIGQGVGEGDVTLNNVKVTGELVALGGGENSIKLTNTSVGKIIVAKVNGKLRILAAGTTTVGSVDMKSGGKLEEDGLTGTGFGAVTIMEILPGQELLLDGDFDEVVVEAPGAKIDVVDGSVGKMTVAPTATETKVNVSEKATVKEVKLQTAVAVTGSGKVEKAVVEADGASFEKAPTVVQGKVGSTVTVGNETVIVDQEEVAGGPVTTPTTGGNTGGNTTPTVTNKQLLITMAYHSYQEPVNITAASNASNATVLGVMFDGILGVDRDNNASTTLFDEMYARYEVQGGNFFIEGLNFFDYADQAAVVGTLFADVANEVGTKAKLEKVLSVIDANLDNLDQVEADAKHVAHGVDFASISYGTSEKLREVWVEEVGVAQPLVEFKNLADTDEQDQYITVLFDILSTITMSTDKDYRLTVITDVYASNGDRTNVNSRSSLLTIEPIQ